MRVLPLCSRNFYIPKKRAATIQESSLRLACMSGRHPAIGTVKDLASAGAFLAQMVAALVWIAALIERLT